MVGGLLVGFLGLGFGGSLIIQSLLWSFIAGTIIEGNLGGVGRVSRGLNSYLYCF